MGDIIILILVFLMVLYAYWDKLFTN